MIHVERSFKHFSRSVRRRPLVRSVTQPTPPRRSVQAHSFSRVVAGTRTTMDLKKLTANAKGWTKEFGFFSLGMFLGTCYGAFVASVVIYITIRLVQ